jgi:hypothetical protein
VLHGTQLFGFGKAIKRLVDDVLAGTAAESESEPAPAPRARPAPPAGGSTKASFAD